MSVDDLEPLWLNEPRRWRRAGSELVVTTDPDTDFWRHTHYGFVHDSGHFYGARVPGEFTAQVEVRGAYTDQFDQAGLMVRLDAERWIKCGIELVDGVAQVGAVVTHAVSDWSVTPLPAVPASLGLRVTRSGDCLTVEYRVGSGDAGVGDVGPGDASPRDWTVHRLAFLPPGLPVSVGPMAASPKGSGFEVHFRDLEILPR